MGFQKTVKVCRNKEENIIGGEKEPMNRQEEYFKEVLNLAEQLQGDETEDFDRQEERKEDKPLSDQEVSDITKS